MIESKQEVVENAALASFQRGRRMGLATAALALGVISFLNLLGAEKSLLAIALAFMALRGAEMPNQLVRNRARIALTLGVLHMLTIVVILALFQDDFRELLNLVYELS